MTWIEKIAEWVHDVEYEDVPPRVMDIAKSQILSVLGAVWAGEKIRGGKAVAESVPKWSGEGPCTVFPRGDRVTLPGAIVNNCALSIALDYDDYLFMGHTGHSAVSVSWAVGEYSEAETRDILLSQVIGNEVGGRLGASLFVGPHNGQMWAQLHHLSAAAITSRLLKLDKESTANALGIALADPVYPLYPGFLEPQSKLLTASFPALTGTLSALMAAEGMTGSHVILEDTQGLWNHLTYVPLPFMMTGLGESWVTDTIAFKKYPGCAYIDTSIDALLEICDEYREVRGEDMQPEEIKSIDVEVGVLTIAMDDVSHEYLRMDRLSPTNINFSLGISIALCLLNKGLSADVLRDEILERDSDRIRELAGRVNLKHDLSSTIEMIQAMHRVIDLKAMLSQVDLKRLFRARSRIREGLTGVGISFSGLREAVKSISLEQREFLRSMVSWRGRAERRAVGYDLGTKPLQDLTLPFGARVTVTFTDGTSISRERDIPDGGPGDPNRLSVAEAKFLRESAWSLGGEEGKRAVSLIKDFEDQDLRDVINALVKKG